MTAPKPTHVRRGVLIYLCAAAVIAYVHRTCIAVDATTIRKDLNLTEAQMGWVMSGFFLTYSFLQIPSGWMGNTWGTRRALTFFSLVGSASVLAMGCAWNFTGMFASRLLAGGAQAGLFPCAVNSISKWFPPAERAFPNGMLGGFMSVGGILAAALTGFLLEYLDWRSVFFLFSVPGFLWAAGFHAWFRDTPAEHSQVNEEERRWIGTSDETPSRTPTPWITIFTDPVLVMLYLQQFFRAGGYVFYATWFPTFLQEAHSATRKESGYWTSLPLLGVALGNMAGGVFTDWLMKRTGSARLSRQVVGVVSQVLCALLFFLAFALDDVKTVVLSISLGALFFGFGSCVAYTSAIDLGGKQVATVFSTMNMAGNIGATVCPAVVPFVRRSFDGWQPVLLFFSLIYAAAAVSWMFVNPCHDAFANQEDQP